MLLAFKLKIAVAAAAGFVTPFAITPFLIAPAHIDRALEARQAVVELAPGSISYRLSGEFTRDDKQIEAPRVELRIDRPLSMMLHQVSAADYQLCVDAGGCHAMPSGSSARTDRPAVQVSWQDASDYAVWLSAMTRQHYRLPTDAEWAYAAASRFKDDGLTAEADDPSVRWIARYEREAQIDKTAIALRGFGGFGANERGLLDLAGNVWEWTSTCFVRSALDASGRTVTQTSNCGVRIAEGQHRAYVSDFVRDAKAGGCSAGLPPTHLGFRLVREPGSAFAGLRARLTSTLARTML